MAAKKPITKEELENLRLRFKFNDSILEILNKKYKKPLTYRKTYKKIKKLEKPSISNEIIQSFYSDPKYFFGNQITLLNKTSYFDECGNSIFAHYFFVLYEIFIGKNNANPNNEIYISNFLSFFKTYEKYIAIQDLSLDTPFHKIAKLRNKLFFIKYYNLLNHNNIIDEKILSIKNINDESCFDLIINEIEINDNKFTKNDYELYKGFLNSNKTYIESLPLKKQLNLKLFSLSINFHKKLYKDITFKEIYIGLNVLLKNEKEKIINYDYFFNKDINILNCLYHYCKTEDDFNKLFKYIIELSDPILDKLNKSKETVKKKKKEISLRKFIYIHIGYVLRKMNKKDNTGIYGIKLINDIIPKLLNDCPFDVFKDKEIKIKSKKLKFKKYSLGINVAKNANLNFEEKCEILNLLEDKLKEHFLEDIDEDVIYLYRLFKLYDKKVNNKKVLNETSITIYFKKNKYVRKIFSDFFFIGKLYRTIYFLCKKYDNINLGNYIKELNKFLMKKIEIFYQYKASYSMNDKHILTIINIIILFEKINYCNKIEENFLPKKIILLNNQSKAKYEKLCKKFILSFPKLTLYYMKDIISISQNSSKNAKMILYSNFLDVFFSFKYDFEKLSSDKNIISYFSNKNFKEFKIYEKKLKENLSVINNNKNALSIYKFILKFSPHINNIFIFNCIILKFKFLMKKYLYQLSYKWNEDYNFNELSLLIKENIIPFCKLFLDSKDTLEDRKNKINFFFDEFITLLNSEFRNSKYQQYKQLALNYMDLNQDSDDNYFYHLDYKIYLSMMLIFIRLKFGKYNPSFLFGYILNDIKENNYFLLFLKSYFNNENKNDILNHYLLLESNLSSLYPNKYKINYIKYKGNFYYPELSYSEYTHILLFYLSYISSKLKYIKYSFIFDYIKSLLDYDVNFHNKNNYNFLKESFKYSYFSISFEQNQDLFNLMLNLIFKKKIIKSIFSFFDVEPIIYNEENIKHRLKIFNEISFNLDKMYKENEIEDIFDEKVNEQTYENIIKCLKVLKKGKDSFFNCIKNNRYLIKLSLNYLLKNYYFYLIQKTNNKINITLPDNEDSEILNEEIYNFLNFYKSNCKPNNEYTKDFSEIFFSLCQYNEFIDKLKKILI